MTAVFSEAKLKILLISDAKQICENLEIILKTDFPSVSLTVGMDIEDVLTEIRKTDSDLLFIDMSIILACEYDLLQAIRKDKEIADSYICLIAKEESESDISEYLNYGVDDLIFTSYSHTELRLKLRNVLHNIDANERLQGLSNNFHSGESLECRNVKKIIAECLRTRIPNAVLLGEKVARISTHIAKEYYKLDQSIVDDIDTASLLYQIGKIVLDDELKDRPLSIGITPAVEDIKTVCIRSRMILKTYPRFEKAAEIVSHIYENYDGSGVPDKLRFTNVPIGSRILRPIIEFVEMTEIKDISTENAISEIKKYSKRLYNPKAVNMLNDYVQSEFDANERRVKEVSLDQLEAGCRIARDIVTYSGKKLIATGSTPGEAVVNRIKAVHRNDPIIGHIYIYR